MINKISFKGGGHHFHGSNMDTLIHKVMRSHLNHTSPDACLSIETHLFNVLLTVLV